MAGYYNAHTAIDYNVLLKHFKNQAAGNNRVALLPAHLSKTPYRRNSPASMVIIDKTKPSTTNTRGQHLPTMEVIDETEAAKKRAETELERQTENTDSSTPESISVVDAVQGSHLQTKRPRKRTQQGKKSLVTPRAKVKRARDLFDN